jgi:hypothetical protein
MVSKLLKVLRISLNCPDVLLPCTFHIAMPLVTRGRLSVQAVSEECWGIIHTMAEKGGWEEMAFGKKKSGPRKTSAKNSSPIQKTKANSTDDDRGNAVEAEAGTSEDILDGVEPRKKRKASEIDQDGLKEVPRRRSVRTKKEK